MADKKPNKVVFGATSIMDISDSTVSPEKLTTGEIAYDASGEKIEGANPYEITATNAEVNAQSDLIAQIKTVLKGKAESGTSGDVGGLSQYIKTVATPKSNVSFVIENPLGGLAKKVSIKCPEGSATETVQGKVQRYTIDTTVGLGCMKLLNASTGNITLYGVRQVDTITSNSTFAVSDGQITLRAYNQTTAIWDVSCEYEVEIWQ